jgi:hypothetical protein
MPKTVSRGEQQAPADTVLESARGADGGDAETALRQRAVFARARKLARRRTSGPSVKDIVSVIREARDA